MSATSIPRPAQEARTIPWSGSVISALSLALVDLCTATGVLLSVVVVRHWFHGEYPLSLYLRLWPVPPALIAAYCFAALYPGFAVDSATELRRATVASSLVFMMLAVAAFISRQGLGYSRSIFVLSWLVLLFAVPLARGAARLGLARSKFWGCPTAIAGPIEEAERLVRALRAAPASGLRPVAVLSEQGALSPGASDLIAGPYALGEDLPQMGVRHAIVCLPQATSRQIAALIDAHLYLFPVIYIDYGANAGSILNVAAFSLGRTPLLCVENRLLMPGRLLLKRIVDLLASCFLIPLALLPSLGIALLIRIDSPGPIFFRQVRIGRGGKSFSILKFRTMAADAQNAFSEHLRERPDLAAEWKRTQKLRRDPRITRIGRYLRKTSLDELPQLLNVLMGDMSLVGPRPIVRDEILKYGAHYNLYLRVRPGVTGLWQVSGRSRTTYAERIALDEYYVRNWNLWLDLVVLGRTLREVLTTKGAC